MTTPATARRLGIWGAAAALACSAAPATAIAGPDASPRAKADPRAAKIMEIVRRQKDELHLRSVIVRVTDDGRNVVTRAIGESMTGVPATPRMHFRNGAVAISYMSTLLLTLVDDGKVSLDDKLSRWLPELPASDQVTLRMLADMTAGYYDYEGDQQFAIDLYRNPFATVTTARQLRIATSQPLRFAPGTNWGYSHSDYVILGRALEEITGKPLAVALRERVLAPLGLRNTRASTTAAIPRPVLHAFSSERREVLGIAPDTPFYEESTSWNPSWTLARGAVQTTNIYDMATTAEAIGDGRLLSRRSHRAQIAKRLLGFGSPIEGNRASFTQSDRYNYGLGVVNSGNWRLQNPLFGGYAAVEAVLPSRKLAVAVAVTFEPEAFDADGGYAGGNAADTVFREIGALLAPDDAPPVRTGSR